MVQYAVHGRVCLFFLGACLGAFCVQALVPGQERLCSQGTLGGIFGHHHLGRGHY